MNARVQLGGTRRITVRAFKGKTYIDIREVRLHLDISRSPADWRCTQFYEEKGSGDMKPGKKGISLNVEAVSRTRCLLSTKKAI